MKIKIFGKDYEFKKIKNFYIDGSKCWGGCRLGVGIYLEKEAPKDLQESTLIHEIIEAINWELELNLEHNKITALESGLYQVLKDNKLIDFSKYIK